jgi:hypothetical protein
VPLSVPPDIVRIGIDCAAALLSVSVPPAMVSFEVSVPAKVLVPACTCSVPAPEMVEAASNDEEVV